MTVADVGRVLLVLWAIESLAGVVITSMNLGAAFALRALALDDPSVTPEEVEIARTYVAREGFRLAVAIIFLVIALYVVGQLFGIFPSSGGIVVSIGLVIANGIIVVNSINDQRLRTRLRRKKNGNLA